MSIATDKALNLGGAKILYDDLRGRINSCAPKASPEFTGSISLGRMSETTVGENSFTAGKSVIAAGKNQTVLGMYNVADDLVAYVNGSSYSIGDRVYNVENRNGSYYTVVYECTVSNSDGSFNSGHWEQIAAYYGIINPNTNQSVSKTSKYVEIVGNGTSSGESNARALDWDGNERLMGDLYFGCNADSTGGTKLGDALDLKAPKASPEFTGSISLGRKENTTIGDKSFAVGYNVEASGVGAHAEGINTKAAGSYVHAEGIGTEAYGSSSHAEGLYAKACANNSHAEGENTIAYGTNTHVFGLCNTEDNEYPAWARNTEYHVGDKVNRNYVGWMCNTNHTSTRDFETSKWDNIKGTSNYVEIVGNGTKNGGAVSSRSNARTLDWNGNERLMGDLYVGCNADSTGGNKVISESDILAIYTGVAEYTPTINPVFAPGIFYHQTGTNYIGVIKGNNMLTPFNLSGVEIPSKSDSNWDIMYFGDPGLKEAMIFPIPGITEYTPAASLSMDADTFYHEVGSKYVCVLNDAYLPEYSASGDAGTFGSRVFGNSPVYHLPITSTNPINVYTLGSFMSAWRNNRVSRSNPVFSGELSIKGAKLSRETMLTLLGLINNNGTYDTPPTTIKLGNTTITETQLQALLATLN